MKNIFLITLGVCLTVAVSAQSIAINTTGDDPDNSAILDISSQDKGILIPRMTSLQRQAITAPRVGLLVFDTDTESFWFYTSIWSELMSGDEMGSAGGDLIGQYPEPVVAKIQGNAIDTLSPADGQVLKWNAQNDMWKAMKDSLVLPYAGVKLHPGNLFSVNNTFNGFAYTTAIHGQRMNPSGIALTASSGVWGDANIGTGVAGTSNFHTGVFGNSLQEHGMVGTALANNKAGVYGTSTNSNGFGIGVLGELSQDGIAVNGKTNNMNAVAGRFENLHQNSNAPALVVMQHGLEAGASIINSNIDNDNPALNVYSEGDGEGIYSASQSGVAGRFEIENPDNASTVLHAKTVGDGTASVIQKIHTDPDGPILPAALIENYSYGDGLRIVSSYTPSSAHGLDVEHHGNGAAVHVESNNIALHAKSISNVAAVFVENNSIGSAVSGITNATGTPALLGSNAATNGVGVRGTASTGVGVEGIGAGVGVKGLSSGPGPSGIGVLGIGETGDISAIGVKGISETTSNDVGSVTGINSGTGGIGVYGESQAGIGVKGHSNSPTKYGVMGTNWNGGTAIHGTANGPGARGVVGLSSNTPDAPGVGVDGVNFGVGDGVRGTAGSAGNGIAGWDGTNGIARAGFFRTQYSGNPSVTVRIENNGIGASLSIENMNASNTAAMTRYRKSGTADFAVYELSDGDNKIRFDHTGKGFFDGGTQTGGADIAEVFDVENDFNTYAPGDVLVISTVKDRTVVKSSAPYSTLVAGVFATKPGLLMTEEHIDADLSGKVPMGVVGVIPTKVCLEGGEIRRGDLLVTSSIPGVAMKGDPDKIKTGQVLGKALENYAASSVALIRVLVNVK